MLKNSIAMKQQILLINRHRTVRTTKTGWPFCLSRNIYTYSESACNDKQNGGHRFIL